MWLSLQGGVGEGDTSLVRIVQDLGLDQVLEHLVGAWSSSSVSFRGRKCLRRRRRCRRRRRRRRRRRHRRRRHHHHHHHHHHPHHHHHHHHQQGITILTN